MVFSIYISRAHAYRTLVNESSCKGSIPKLLAEPKRSYHARMLPCTQPLDEHQYELYFVTQILEVYEHDMDFISKLVQQINLSPSSTACIVFFVCLAFMCADIYCFFVVLFFHHEFICQLLHVVAFVLYMSSLLICHISLVFYCSIYTCILNMKV